MIVRLLSLFAILAVATTMGCFVFDDDPPGVGHTACGDFSSLDDVFCPPGSYCVDPTFSECEPGCLSNENCAEDQRCVKTDGTDVGTCQNQFKIRPDGGSGPGVGVTPCGESFDGEASYCQPGAYCKDARFQRCEPGCLSDANCFTNELCDKAPGQATGVCQKPAE